MRNSAAALALVALAGAATAAPTNASHSLVRLFAPFPPGLGRASAAAARAVREAPNASAVQVGVSAAELSRLRALRAAPEVVAADLGDFFERRAAAELAGAGPGGRRLQRLFRPISGAAHPQLLGSMGGFYTLAQARAEMTRLVGVYPDWIAPAVQFGTTNEGRPLEVSCITAQRAGCDGRSDRPAVLYTAAVHSREPATVMCLVQFVRQLLQDAAAGDEHTLRLLATRKILVRAIRRRAILRRISAAQFGAARKFLRNSLTRPSLAAAGGHRRQPRRVLLERAQPPQRRRHEAEEWACLLYTSDAADEG